jgi:hypothetical protein
VQTLILVVWVCVDLDIVGICVDFLLESVLALAVVRWGNIPLTTGCVSHAVCDGREGLVRMVDQSDQVRRLFVRSDTLDKAQPSNKDRGVGRGSSEDQLYSRARQTLEDSSGDQQSYIRRRHEPTTCPKHVVSANP